MKPGAYHATEVVPSHRKSTESDEFKLTLALVDENSNILVLESFLNHLVQVPETHVPTNLELCDDSPTTPGQHYFVADDIMTYFKNGVLYVPLDFLKKHGQTGRIKKPL